MVLSTRSDSSASSNQIPLSPIPSSVEAKGKSSAITSRMNPSKSTNGHAVRPESFGMRARSASLQKGVAVLKALARAPQEGEEEDSGYEDDGGENDVGMVPGKIGQGAQEDKAGSTDSLSEEAKESGRLNREGLRKRNDDRQVERLVGTRTKSSGSTDSTTSTKRKEKKKPKSWELPRKIFHSSIGFLVLYLYLSHTNLSLIVRNLSIFLAIVITADVLRLNIPAFETIYEMVLGFLMRESEKEKVNGVVWYLVGVITCLQFFPSDIACVSVMVLSWADTSASVFGRLYGASTPALPSPPFAGRKSSAGFLAAVIVASLTAAVFWATPIAEIGKRAEGLSIYDDFGRAVLGTSRASGSFGSGWSGLRWGFRPTHPKIFTASNPQSIFNTVSDSVKMAKDAAFSTQEKSIPLPLLCLASGVVAAVAESLELGGVDDNLSLPILTAVGIHLILVGWGNFASRFS